MTELKTNYYEPDSRDFSHIIDSIYVGNAQSLTDEWVKNNVQNIISLFETKEAYEHTHNFFFIDRPKICVLPWAKKIYPLLLKLDKPILVHCAQGKSRSVAIVLFYMMKKHNLTFDESFAIMEKQRSDIKLNKGFRKQLQSWGEQQTNRVKNKILH
jgi:protein tyrosine/serine phosphatase